MALPSRMLSEGVCVSADNRLRVWDRLVGVDGPPDREIVHSHDFNRYLTVRPGAARQQQCGGHYPCIVAYAILSLTASWFAIVIP